MKAKVKQLISNKSYNPIANQFEIWTDKGYYEKIESIEEIFEPNRYIEVYNLEVEKDNTYFAENYLVHNLCGTCSGLSSRILNNNNIL